jgi:sortase A
MALYSYKKEKFRQNKALVNFISYSSMIIGSFFLFWSFYPVVSFEIYSYLFIKNKIFSPIPRSEAVSSLEAANSILGQYNIFSTNLADYTKVGVWFPSKPQIQTDQLKVREYTLSIPKLNIKDAKVIVGGEDLSRSLVHYIPKSLPGEYGNVTIFGHSTLPQLYNTDNYKTIFTYLPSLEKNDKIYVKIDELIYEYEVYDMFVIKPDEISVLDQRYDNAYLTLITCVPPGTYWKRLVVRTKLTKLQN